MQNKNIYSLDSRFYNERIALELKQHDAENLALAEKREQELLEKRGLIDVMLDLFWHKKIAKQK